METAVTAAAETTQPNCFDFGDIHYTLQVPTFEIVKARGIWGIVEYGNFVYDENGLLIEKTDLPNASDVYTNEYDEQGRLVQETETHAYGSSVYLYTYEDVEPNAYREITPFQNKRGLVSTVKNRDYIAGGGFNTFHYEYQFDDYGRVIQCAYSNRAIDSKIVQDFEYDENGRIVRELQKTYDNGRETSRYESVMTYDGLGRLVRDEFVDLSDGYTSFFANIYGVSRYVEISTATDETLMTTDHWKGFPENPALPTPSSCIKGIDMKGQEQDGYAFALSDDREEADRQILKYLTILTDVCGFTYVIGEEAVHIYEADALKAELVTGTDPIEGCFLQMRCF